MRFIVRSRLKGAVLAGLVLSGAAFAETAYVTDVLYLSIYADERAERRMDTLKSGDALRVLRRSGDYTQVRTPGGQTGWVKDSFLVSEKPAVLRSQELEVDVVTLKQQNSIKDADIKKLKAQLKAQKKQAGQPVAGGDSDQVSRQELAASRAALANAQSRVAQLEKDKADLILKLKKAPGPSASDTKNNQSNLNMILWALPVLTLIIGFLVGWKMLERRIRDRFSGYLPL